MKSSPKQIPGKVFLKGLLAIKQLSSFRISFIFHALMYCFGAHDLLPSPRWTCPEVTLPRRQRCGGSWCKKRACGLLHGNMQKHTAISWCNLCERLGDATQSFGRFGEYKTQESQRFGSLSVLCKPWNHGSKKDHPFPNIDASRLPRMQKHVIPWIEPHFANGARLLTRRGSIQRGRVSRSMIEKIAEIG